MHGRGKITFAGGGTFVGEVCDGERHSAVSAAPVAQGRHNFDAVDEEQMDSMLVGASTSLYVGGIAVTGQWAHDYLHGTVMCTFPGGSTYKGGFVNGSREGHGIATYASGLRYSGAWKAGRRHGFGRMTSATGYKYIGAWVAGDVEGFGTVKLPCGAKVKRRWERAPFHEVVRAAQEQVDSDNKTTIATVNSLLQLRMSYAVRDMIDNYHDSVER
jgi:hypothetical protein